MALKTVKCGTCGQMQEADEVDEELGICIDCADLLEAFE